MNDRPAQTARAATAEAYMKTVMGRINLERKGERPYTQAELEAFKHTVAKYIMALK